MQKSNEPIPGLKHLASFSIFEDESGGCFVKPASPEPQITDFFPILGVRELDLVAQWIGEAIETLHPFDPRAIKGYVYLVEGQEKCFKIGYTNNLERRIWDQISPVMPYPLKLIHSIETRDCIELETRIHAAFDDKRLNGEWFKLDDADIDRFKDIGDHE